MTPEYLVALRHQRGSFHGTLINLWMARSAEDGPGDGTLMLTFEVTGIAAGFGEADIGDRLSVVAKSISDIITLTV